MKTWGSWAKVPASISVLALVGSLSMVFATQHVGKHSVQSRGTASPTVTGKTGRLAQANENPRWMEAYGKLPLSFEENRGQTATEVRYVSHSSGFDLFLTPQEAVVALRPSDHLDFSPRHRFATLRALREARRNARPMGQTAILRLQLEGANAKPEIAGTDPLPGRVNYFIGNDPKKWHTDIHTYAKVKYVGIYPGVDLIFYGNRGRLEYDFVVAPGANPGAIALNLNGARKMHINSHGDVIVSVPGGEVELQKPVIYQQVKGERREVAGSYAISKNHRVTFSVPRYDRSQQLVLDPVLNYSTYVGGTSNDNATGIALDANGDAFIAGISSSTDFPTTSNGFTQQPLATNISPATAAFVAELNPAGTTLLYSSYIAGATTPGETAFGVAADPTGKAVYVTGQTLSADFPTNSTVTGFKTGNNAGVTGVGTSFLVKFDPTQTTGANSFVYSTFIGGTNGTGGTSDLGLAVAADVNGVAYVVGLTDSTPGNTLADFPVVNGFQTTLNNVQGNAFLTKIDTTKSGAASLIYSTYLGGNGVNSGSANGLGVGDAALGVAIDSSGKAYLAGSTSSTDFNTLGTANGEFLTYPAGNTSDVAFFCQIDTTKLALPSLLYLTYLGGTGPDFGNAIGLGPNNVAYLAGNTSSLNFPVSAGAFQTTGNAAGVGFVSLIDPAQPAANSLTHSTFLGGTGGDDPRGIQADAQGNAYVAGATSSTNFPVSAGAFQTNLAAGAFGNGFVSQLNPSLTTLLYSTYFGGSGDTNNQHLDTADGIALDSSNPPNVYIAGQTFSTDLPIAGTPVAPLHSGLNGTGSDAYVAKLTLIPTLGIIPAVGTTLDFGTIQIGSTSAAQTVTLTNNTNGNIAFTSAALSGTNAADYSISTAGCSPNIVVGTPCVVSVKFTPTVVAPPSEVATLTITDADSTSPQVYSLTGKGTNTALPGVGLAPTSLAFGNQAVSTTSAAMPVTLTNTGTGALTINSIAASGDFAATSTGATACPISPATLAAGANCTINVTFTPTALGARAGNLTITDNATGSPHTVPLTGTGTAAAAPGVGLAPTSLAFGNQALTTTSAAKPVTLTNTGTAALTITSIAASGDFAATSAGAAACPISPATLAAGANCTINVTFTPTALGARAGNLTITDNATGSPQVVPLTGTGTGTPDFGLTGPTSAQNVTLGQTLNFSVTVTGTGGFNSPVALACTGAPALAVCTVTSPVTPPVAPPSTIQAQVSMTTTALIPPPLGMPTPTAPPQQLVPLVLALMLLLSLVWARQPRLRLAMATAALMLIALTGCNGIKHQSTPKGPATLTITGTSGALTHNVQVQISVN
ncbi:MAG TPA: choice-of-anchor D domain-containing protein [Candidatus Acidoferrum sp.]|nr:choice-of-anchor D domain-containing protein [Candidatus Acidoferrum sp.]